MLDYFFSRKISFQLFRRSAKTKISAFQIILLVDGTSSAKATFLLEFANGFSLGAIKPLHFSLRAVRLEISRALAANTLHCVFLGVGDFWHNV